MMIRCFVGIALQSDRVCSFAMETSTMIIDYHLKQCIDGSN